MCMPKRSSKKASRATPAPKKRAAKTQPKPKAQGMDEVQAAHALLQRIISGHDPEARKALMREMGRKGGQIGGRRRADNMTPEERRESAQKAARVRWGVDYE